MEEYENFNGEFLELVRDTNIPEAKSMLDRILTLVNPPIAQKAKQLSGAAQQPVIDKVRTAVKNIFGILLDADMQPMDSMDERRLATLRSNVQKVRQSFNLPFPKVFQDHDSILAAWVSNNFADETVNFSPMYLDLPALDQAVTLVHERSHTILKISGHPGTGDSPVCIVPHEGKKLGFDVAIRNAYCYEWLALALHPSYNPTPYRDLCNANSITGHSS
jgi:hypothetical protein